MTNAELAILGLIAEEPSHGYQVEQVIEERGMREWTELGFSSIYYVLRRLEKEGLVESRTERPAGRGPARQVYHITSAGRAALRARVLDALSIPRRCYLPLQLGLANLPFISPPEAMEALQQYQAELAARLEQLKGKWETQRPLPYFVDAMFEHSMAMIRAEQEWLVQFMDRLRDQTG